MDKLPNHVLLTEFAKKHPNYHITHVNDQQIPFPQYECHKWYIRIKADKYPKLDDAVVTGTLYSSPNGRCDEHTLYVFRTFIASDYWRSVTI
jgi:hypothetical protein